MTRRLFGDGTLRVDLTVAAVVVLALAVTGWLIRAELHRGSGQDGAAVRVAVAERLVGSARRRPDSSLVWSRVDVGEPLMRGDGVFVAADSALDVHFHDGSHLLVGESSLVVVDVPEAESEQPRVQVRSGSVAGRAGSDGLLFEVDGGSVALGDGGVANISGGGAGTEINVEEGQATVADGSGAATRVGPKQATRVADGRVAPPRDLPIGLEEPAVAAKIFFTGEAAVVPFAWSGGAGVLEVADDASFATARRREAEAGVSLRLPAGSYFWRVTDDSGVPQSSFRAVHVVRDDPPTPMQPAARAVVYVGTYETGTFAWTRVTGVRRYRVEIAPTVEFRETAFSVEVDAPQLRFATRLPEGEYFWRVRSVAPERGESPWSAAVPFKLAVDPLPRAPELYDSEVEVIDGAKKKTKTKTKTKETREDENPDEGASLLYRLFVGGVAHAAAPSAAIILRWEAVPGVRGYILEIAEDESFERVVVREELTENWYRWQKISKREYWWRVKSVDARGREGVFGAPRSVGAVLHVPELRAPAAGERVSIGATVPAVEFTWDEQRLAGRYEWSIAGDADFSRAVVTQSTAVSKVSWKPSRAGTHFWRVRAADAGGSFTGYSEIRQLEVVLSAPTYRKVAGVPMTDPPPKIELAARPVATSSRYQVQIAPTRSFADARTSAELSEPRWVFEPELAGTWWWRWRAISGTHKSSWGPSVSLTLSLAKPVITAPAAGARLGFRTLDSELSVAWEPVPGARGFEVSVSTGEREVARAEAAAPPATLAGVPAGRYRVTVRALPVSGAPVVSEPVAFEWVELPALAAPSLSEPEAGAWLVAGGPELEVQHRWQSVGGATGYELEVSAAGSEDWQRTRVDSSGAVRALGRGAYAWRVRALDQSGVPGPYSESFEFRVGSPPPTDADIDVSAVEPGAGARIDILLTDAEGEPVTDVEVEASAARGSIRDLRHEGGGRWVARYQPSAKGEDDTVAVTVRGLTSFRVEEPIEMSGSLDLVVGGALGLVANFGAVLSPTVQPELGYRLPWWQRRLVATLRVGYHYARVTAGDGPLRAVAKQYSVPVALGLRLEFPYWEVVPYGTANVLLGVMVGRLKATGQDAIYRTKVGLGPELGGGAALSFGPGAIFAELRYGFVRGSDDQELLKLDAGGLVTAIGYRLDL